jgi:hypothetical protein
MSNNTVYEQLLLQEWRNVEFQWAMAFNSMVSYGVMLIAAYCCYYRSCLFYWGVALVSFILWFNDILYVVVMVGDFFPVRPRSM